MKRAISVLLIAMFLISVAGCAKPEEAAGENSIDFSGEPAVTAAQPSNTPGTDPVGAAEETPVPGDPAAEETPAPAEETPKGPEVADSTPPPAEKTSGPEPKNYKEAAAINSDCIGWIKVPGTNINYPIMYDDSGKWFYNNHDIYKNSTGNPGAGSIYSYYDVLTRNVIVSGHNMRKAGTMFHELHSIQNNASSLSTKANRTFSVQLFGKTTWEVFALYETKDNEPASTLKYNIKHLSDASPSDIEKWISTQKERSEVKLDVSVSADDIFMTLVTCGDNYDYSDAQSRLYVFLKCVK
ncbi:MAG: sortase [Eubacteriales bacterium]|nr:sortase [Eubacteriales bacterium]